MGFQGEPKANHDKRIGSTEFIVTNEENSTKMKKIGILTLPIKTNYGGILQAYALLAFLRKEGYDAWFIKRRWNSESQNQSHKIAKKIYHSVVIRKFNRFICQYIQPQTEVIDTREKVNSLLSRGFDSFIVGSDQVWRMRHVRGADYNYFLDFTKGHDVKRMAYAASFGVDYWDDTRPEESLPKVKKLLQAFDAISVREDTGVKLCKSLFDINALHVLDPTLLLNKEEYISNFKLHIKQKKYIAVYILDMTEEKRQIIHTISEKMSLPVKYTNSSSCIFKRYLPKSMEEMQKPGVKDWITTIGESSFVITDSFHGTAFSIIFEKQFIAIGNLERGLTRFQSLLNLFDLNNRLILNQESLDTNDIVSNPIDYKQVNAIKKKKQQDALNFIKQSLS